MNKFYEYYPMLTEYQIDDREDVLHDALRFAQEKHNEINQLRKYTGQPYWTHPLAVCNIVRTVPHNLEQLIASLLHDTVEDTNTTIEEIKSIFGEKVAILVGDLTDISKPSDGNRKTRKEIDLQHTKNASQEAKTVKLADLIHNSISITQYDPDFSVVYMREKARLLEVLKEGDQTLYTKAVNIVNKYNEIYNKNRL